MSWGKSHSYVGLLAYTSTSHMPASSCKMSYRRLRGDVVVNDVTSQSSIRHFTTRRWHVTISCQPDGRPPQPAVRPWKSGRVHLAEGSNVYSCFSITVFYGVRAWLCCHLPNVNKTCPRPNFEKKNNNMTRGSQGFVGQTSPNLAHV